jgi:DNA helicase II / ATP-dependent DNA helicase PcrA
MNRSIFVVGDDAQSIYGFRGSNIDIILTFDKIYRKTKEIVLNQNYRSNQAILDLAENVIKQNSNQKKKGLFTDNKDKKNVSYYTAGNEKDEAEFIVRTLHNLYVKNLKKPTSQSSSPDSDNYTISQQLSQDLSLKNLQTLG